MRKVSKRGTDTAWANKDSPKSQVSKSKTQSGASLFLLAPGHRAERFLRRKAFQSRAEVLVVRGEAAYDCKKLENAEEGGGAGGARDYAPSRGSIGPHLRLSHCFPGTRCDSGSRVRRRRNQNGAAQRPNVCFRTGTEIR